MSIIVVDILAIEKTKLQWQSAADLMPQLICLLDGDGRVLHANRTIERWGLGKVSRVRGMQLHDILHPGCSSQECYFRRFWAHSMLGRLEGRRVERGVFDPVHGRHFHIRVQPLQRQGQTDIVHDLHSVVVVDDVSDLKRAEAAVQHRYEELTQKVRHETERRELSEEMQARLLTILEKTTDFVAITNAAEFLLYLNPAGRRMLGFGPGEDLSSKRLGDHADPDARQHLRHVAIPNAIKNGLWAGESRMRDRDGKEIHTSQVIIAHTGANGQIDCFSTILRDITARVKTEQALRESREELRQLSSLLVSVQEEERRRIALDLHDGLGQSLSLIKLSAENLAEQLAAGKSESALDQLRQITGRIREALSDVRRVATDLRPSILDDLGILSTLSWFFREFESACGQMALEKDVSIREEDVPPPLKITIYRILQEATSNIVKHSAASRLRISLHRDETGLQLLIADDGCGFDPDSVRCSPETCRGLGLASMKERVSLSGGIFSIESRTGAGTRVRATWPLEPDAAGE